MRASDLARMLTLAALWGSSYLFMRIAVPHVGPAWMVEGRTLAGGLAMAAFVLARGAPVHFAKFWPGFLMMGIVGIAIPFWLIGKALETIDASTAAILNATAPIFGAIVAAFWIGEKLTLEKVTGIALSITGIAILVGWTPRPMSGAELLACAFALVACACYGYTAVYTKVKIKGAPPAALSAGSCLVAAAAMAPFTPWSVAAGPVPWFAWGSLAVLGIFCTAIALILYYRLITDLGPVKGVMVTLLIPVFGILWGVLFLGEPLTAGRIAGCATVLLGCALALGLLRLPFRPSAG